MQRGHATTISAIQSFANNKTCLIFLLQEPWYAGGKTPPSHPDFDMFIPCSKQPSCATYVRRLTGLTAHTTLTHKNLFLVTSVTIMDYTFELCNFYTPGRAGPLADFLPHFKPTLPCILMGDLNAHHQWWYGVKAPDTHNIRNFSSSSNKIVDWLEKHQFRLHNTPGRPTHFPRNGNQSSVIDLAFTAGPIISRVMALQIDDDTTSDHSALGLTGISRTP